MNSNDLFSFLDEVPPEDVDNEEDDAMQTDPVPVSSKVQQKRKVPPPLRTDVDDDIDNEPGPSTLKKARISSPKPVVLDDFETEAKREVAASAGLTGSVDAGTRLELKHQVPLPLSNPSSTTHLN